MFKTLAKSWLVPSRRTAPGPRLAITHCNDNLPGFRRPAAGRRRTPALACHWFDRNGRLECRWHAETDDASDGGIDGRGTIRTAEARPRAVETGCTSGGGIGRPRIREESGARSQMAIAPEMAKIVMDVRIKVAPMPSRTTKNA